MLPVSLVVLSFNSAATLRRCITSVHGLASSVLVVDSFSKDKSVEIATKLGATVMQRAFANYSDQRNWASQQVPIGTNWLLHLDSDEYLTPDLRGEILSRLPQAGPEVAGFLMRRTVVFCGKEIRHGDIAATWHLRLFRAGLGQCEDRLYDQHFVAHGPLERLRGRFVDEDMSSLAVWTERHNRWSSAESAEYRRDSFGAVRLVPSLTGSPIERKRWIKERVWTRLPRFWRAFAYFFYRYVLRLGFLDGKEGLIYHTLQAFWFRFLVDSKAWETEHTQADTRSTTLDQ